MIDDIGPGIYGLTPRRVPSGQKEPHITWLMGGHLAAIEKMDWSWFFRLDDGSVIATESTWRVVTPEGVVVTSEDHGQQFGLPAPVDAADLAGKELGELRVFSYRILYKILAEDRIAVVGVVHGQRLFDSQWLQ